MANLTVAVPNALVPDLIIIAEKYLTSKGINFSGMTSVQKGQRYIAEKVKDDLLVYRYSLAEASVATTLNDAKATAEAATKAAITTAQSDAAGITG